jgi:hypothetical protein
VACDVLLQRRLGIRPGIAIARAAEAWELSPHSVRSEVAPRREEVQLGLKIAEECGCDNLNGEYLRCLAWLRLVAQRRKSAITVDLVRSLRQGAYRRGTRVVMANSGELTINNGES